jgi:hypothetical protein
MRKFSLLLVVLLAAGSAGLYGQMAINTEFSITGDAKATLGYDLDHQRLGFKNEFSSNIRLDLVPKQTSKKPGDDDEMPTGWYGMIELKDFRIIIDNKYDDDDADKFIEDGAKTQPGTSTASSASRFAVGPSQSGDGHELAGQMGGSAFVEFPHTHRLTPGLATVDDDRAVVIGPARLLTRPELTAVGIPSTVNYPFGFTVAPHVHDVPAEVANAALPAGPNEWTYSGPDDSAPLTETKNTGPGGAVISDSAVVDSVPEHVHRITATSKLGVNFRDSYKIGRANAPVHSQGTSVQHSHDSRVLSAHDPHGHEPHSHGAYSHAEHTHYGNLVVDNPTIAAKLVNGPLSIKIYAEPGNAAGLIGPVENNKPGDEDGISDTDHKAESDDGEYDVHADLDGQGITLGYDSEDGDVSVALGITSDVTYDAKKADKSPKYGGFAVSGDIKVDIGPAKVALQVVKGIEGRDGDNQPVGTNETGFGAKITGDLGSLSLSAGVDFLLDHKATAVSPAAPTRSLDSYEAGTYSGLEATVPCVYRPGTKDFLCTAKAKVPTPPVEPADDEVEWEFGASVSLSLTDTTKLSAEFIHSTRERVNTDVMVEFSDDQGVIENLKWSLAWGLFDLSKDGWEQTTYKTFNNQSDMLMKGDLSYGFDAMGGKLTPGVSVIVNNIDDDPAEVTTKIKMVLTEAIPLTEIGVQWASESLFEPDDGDDSNNLGVLTAWTKVKY